MKRKSRKEFMKTQNYFITKIYMKALFPNIIAVLGGTINVFFDAIFVGQRLGSVGLESVNQCLPIYLLLCTVGSLFASGAVSLSSIAFGENKEEEGKRIFCGALTGATIVGGILCLLGLIFSVPLAGILGTGKSFPYVLIYLRITLAGGIFKVLLYLPYFYLRMEGKHKRSAFSMLTMTILNIVLDYLFLFHLDYGIAGAAWASVIATAMAVLLSFLFLFTDHSNFAPGIEFLKKEDMIKIIRFGSPMALNNILSSGRIFVVNLILKSMGISGLCAIFAIVNNMNELSICVQNGVPQTASSMTGIFFGEKDSDSVKKMLHLQVLTGVVLSLILSAIFCLLSGNMGSLFGSKENAAFAVICFSISLPLATVNNVFSYYYNSIGQIQMANLITVCRGFLFVIVSCMVFCSLGSRVWMFYPAAEIATLFVCLIWGTLTAAKRKVLPVYLLDDRLEKEGKSISFSVECSSQNICNASEKIREFCESNQFSAKTTMAVSLAIEEILSIISQKSLSEKGQIDVRVLRYDDQGIVRIRSGGKRYNPMEAKDDSMDYMGVRMIEKLSTKMEYCSFLGINTLMIFLKV